MDRTYLASSVTPPNGTASRSPDGIRPGPTPSPGRLSKAAPERQARVVLLTMDFPPNTGGVQQYLFELSRRLGRHCRLAVAFPRGDASLFQDEPFALAPLPSSMPWHFARALAALRPHVTIVGHAHPRILLPAALWRSCCKLGTGRFPPLGARRRPRGHYVALAHSSDFEVAQTRWHAPLFNRLLANARTLVTVSRNSARRLREFGLPDPEIVFPGADPRTFAPPESPGREAPILLTVGRLVPRKGFDLVIAALPSLLQSVPDLQYWIVGDGPERSSLERLARDLNVAHAVRFWGRVGSRCEAETPECLPGREAADRLPSLQRLYRRASIYVMPTQIDDRTGRGEGFPLVYLEASACGLPVVAASAAGAAEAVIDRKTGLLVPPNDKAALKEALTRLLGDAELRRRMGAAGRRWVEREMNWDRVARQFLSIIERATH